MTSLRKAWEIRLNEIEIEEIIGKGAFGVVYSAKWRDFRVAVKTVMVFGGSSMFNDELDREIAMLQLVRHPNIVLFFGAGTDPAGTPFLVTELMELGTLTQYLAKHSVSWRQKIIFAQDTARGMAHVHSLGRMHRDLKGGNLLVSASLRVKVADFGTAALASLVVVNSAFPALKSPDRSLTQGVGTPLWMAPEQMSGMEYGPSADVYSFGIVMWEIAAQTLPWQEIPGSVDFVHELCEIVQSGRRPGISESWPAPFLDLMERCWVLTPSERPLFSAILMELENMDYID